jgi:hypothetical protein
MADKKSPLPPNGIVSTLTDYLGHGDTKLGKGHRRFRSDKAMWDHLNACHDSTLDEITLSILKLGTLG